MECREKKILVSLDGVYPLYSYLLWNKRILFRWKINGERRFSCFFAKLVYERICQLRTLTGDFVVVPVPPRKNKIRENGWDQIAELCSYIEFVHGVKVLRLLERISSVQQKKLDRLSRLESISSSYVLKKHLKVKLPEKVCLIDDVMTTGATIESCASILKNAGVNKVFAISIFSVG